MQPADRAAFVGLLTQALGFWRQDTSDFAIGVWWQACQPFDLDQVRSALTEHAMDPERGQFAPKPADFVRLLHGTQGDKAMVAWGKVLTAMRSVGAYQSVVFDDAAIHAAVEDLGGWPTICRSELDELPFLQRRFCEAHRVASRHPTGMTYPPRLIGVHEAENRTAGRPIAPAIYVGEPNDCAEVEAAGIAGPRVAISTGAALRLVHKVAS